MEYGAVLAQAVRDLRASEARSKRELQQVSRRAVSDAREPE